MPKLDDPIAEISARLTVLEFVLEVMLANDLAAMDHGTSSEFKRDIVSKMGRAYGPMAGDAETGRKWAGRGRQGGADRSQDDRTGRTARE